MKLSKNPLEWFMAILWLAIALAILFVGIIFAKVHFMILVICAMISGGFIYFFSLKDFKRLLNAEDKK